MSEDIINAAVATLGEASKEPPSQEPEANNEAAQADAEAPKQEPAQAVPEEGADKTGEEPVVFPKKAVNAISRRDKIIEKERAAKAALIAERDALQAQIAKIKSSNPQEANDGRPKEEDFETFTDYLKADLLFELERKQASEREVSEKSRQKEQISQQQAAYNAQREQVIVAKGSEHAKVIPDFSSVLQENADIAADLPDYVTQAFLEADDGALAFYNLAKEGRLEDLATMNPYRASMEIAKAQMQKQVQKKMTNAPEPIAPLKGVSGSGEKNIGSMSYSELKKFLAS